MTDKWQPGKTYAPGSLVVPATVSRLTFVQPANAGFESGTLASWTTADPARWAVTANHYEGAYGCRVSGNGLTSLQSTTHGTVNPGQQVSVSVRVKITNAGTNDAHFQAVLQWLDAGGNLLPGSTGFVLGNEVQGKGGYWTASSASGVAPAGAAFFNLSNSANPGSHGSVIDIDAASYSYASSAPPAGLVYKATQAAPGKSAATEPTWPGNTTTPVTDNQVTWQGVIASQIVWQATPILKSGSTEPVWPTDVTGQVHDGSGDWTAVTPMIADAKCPHSKQVVIASEKVVAGDVDITRYSATTNPLDWSTANDAGFIAHGLFSVQETSITALALYRGNIALFTASSLQLWKADPDPAAIVILDTVESVGTTYNRAAVPVEQDVFFTSDLGVRSISVSASQQAMGEGDVGNPMDSVVQALVGPGVTPLAGFFPNLGQTLFFFGNQVVVLFKNKLTKLTGWALYTLPITVTDVATLDGDLYVRDATDIYWFQSGSKTDYGNKFQVVMEWQYLDFGTPGTTKTFMGVSWDADAVGTVSAGYKVQVPTARTGSKYLARATEAFYTMAFVGKAASFKLTMDSTDMDSFSRLNVYFRDGGAL